LDFYSKLGASIVNRSRDNDWALLRFGTTELGLLAHPANPEQNEGKVELNFEFTSSLEGLEKKLRETGVTIARPASDEGFGYQLQLEDPDGLFVKINQIASSNAIHPLPCSAHAFFLVKAAKKMILRTNATTKVMAAVTSAPSIKPFSPLAVIA
jgi:hypothetical protein